MFNLVQYPTMIELCLGFEGLLAFTQRYYDMSPKPQALVVEATEFKFILDRHYTPELHRYVSVLGVRANNRHPLKFPPLTDGEASVSSSARPR